jgi:hypothetical protein
MHLFIPSWFLKKKKKWYIKFKALQSKYGTIIYIMENTSFIVFSLQGWARTLNSTDVGGYPVKQRESD